MSSHLILSLVRLDLFLFFFTDTATTEIYTLSLHDALPISLSGALRDALLQLDGAFSLVFLAEDRIIVARDPHGFRRSEEHTSELQSHVNLVCRLLLEKKKTNKHQ